MNISQPDYNIINGERCCWRCGIGERSKEMKDGLKCTVWGHTFNTHLWKAIKTNVPKNDYPNYYDSVVSNPAWQQWGKIANEYGFDWHESVECGWLSDKHFNAFLEWYRAHDSLDYLLMLAHPDLREITFHSDGTVIVKSGASARRPKKLYSTHPKRNNDGINIEQPDWGNLTKIAIKKLIDDQSLTDAVPSSEGLVDKK